MNGLAKRRTLLHRQEVAWIIAGRFIKITFYVLFAKIIPLKTV